MYKKFFCFMIVCFPFYFKGFTQSTQDQLKQIRSTVIEKHNGEEFYIHTIKRGQTLYMISKAYGLDINVLIRENPQVKEGIKADQKIRIPVIKPQSPENQHLRESFKDKEAVFSPRDSTIPLPLLTNGDSIQQDTLNVKPVYHVALMLPLYLGEVNGISTETTVTNPEEAFKSMNFIQFYEGFRLALDSLEKTGIQMKIHVYDMDKDTVKTKQILKKPELKEMDLILGVLYHQNFKIVAEFARKNNIMIVNPITERSELLKGNPKVIKIRPPKSSQLPQLAGYLEKTYPQAKILILREGVYKDKDAPEILKKECLQRKLNVSITEGLSATITSFSKGKEQVVILFSNNTSYILELTRRMYELRNEYNLVLIGLPSWDKIEGLETEYMVGLQTHIMSPFFVDYQNPETRKFVARFQNTYKTDPDVLALQAYDVTLYFLSALWKYGKNFPVLLPPISGKYTQCTFELKNLPGNGYENLHWEIVKYENFRLIRVN